MWETIQYVSSGFSLAAFVVAVVAWVLKAKSEQKERLIALAKEEERAALVSDALEFFRVDTANLTKAQQYELAREQIRGRAQRFKIVAATVCLLAFIGAVVAVYALTRKGESGGEVQALIEEAQVKAQAGQFAEAWRLGEKALARSPGSKDAAAAQVLVGMTWLRKQGLTQELSDSLNAIIARLRNASTTATGETLATLRAHVGWALFIGKRDESPEPEFEEAVKADASNVFAHAMWGYWLVLRANKMKDGMSHLDMALKVGREKDFVQGLFLGLSQKLSSPDESLELVIELNNIRKRNEVWPLAYRGRIFSGIYYGSAASEAIKRHLSALPAADLLATVKWLTTGVDSNRKDLITAQVMEAAGDAPGALALYRDLMARGAMFSGKVEAGIKRIKQAKNDTKSESAWFLEQAKASDGPARAKALVGLKNVEIDSEQALPVLMEYLKDPDKEIAGAAKEALVSIGRPAIAAVIPLLSSADEGDVISAAFILGRIALEPKLSVTALASALGKTSGEARDTIMEALENFEGDAAPAAPQILNILSTTSDLNVQTRCAYLLGEIGPAAKDAVPQLIELLKSTKDKSDQLNGIAAEALGKIGSEAVAAVPVLIAAMQPHRPFLITQAAGALGMIGAGAKDAIPVLADAAVDDKEHRKNYTAPLAQIAESLANNGETKSLPALKSAFRKLTAANVEPGLITPIREAIDDLNYKARQRD